MKILYLHIGYGKTGTTFLQESFFSKITSICYIGVPPVHSIYKDIDRSIRKGDGKSIKNIVQDFNRFLKINNKFEKFLISSEDFLDYRTPEYDIIKKPFDLNTFKKLKRIHTLSKALEKKDEVEVRIIVTIRNQVDMIQSMFQQLIANRHIFYPEQEFYQKIAKDPNFLFGDMLFYSRLIEKLKEYFPNKFKILIFEKFKQNYYEYMQEISDYLEIDKKFIPPPIPKNITTRKEKLFIKTNKRMLFHYLYKIKSIFTKKPIPKFLKENFLSKKILFRISIFKGPDEKIKNNIKNNYDKSNRELEKLIGLNLRKYGY